eukprot:3740097-Pyramimonas_sp.AAC.1
MTFTSRRRGRRPRTRRIITVQHTALMMAMDGPARLVAQTDGLEARRRRTRRLRRHRRERGIRGGSWAEIRPRDLAAAGACKEVLVRTTKSCRTGKRLYWSARPNQRR